MPDYLALKAKATDAEHAAMTHQQVVDSLSSPGAGVVGSITSSQLLIFGALNGILGKIEDGITGNDEQLKSACIAIKLQLAKDGGSLDMGNPYNIQLIDLFIDKSVMTTGHKAGLLAMATKPGPSWVDENWAGTLTAAQVAYSRGL